MSKIKYVIITPARNEEASIEKTIISMVSQTILPEKWIIISDGSTDNTDEIVKTYSMQYDWIDFVRMAHHSDRQFAAKVYAFNKGYEAIRDITYDIIGNLDADISFERDYLEFLLSKFDERHLLGVAGTPFVENGSHYDYRFTNIQHVSGACQMFRRECFEEIGGYSPIKSGGIDWVAVTTARMKGWETRTFTEKVCYHHRKIGTGNIDKKWVYFRQGQKDYSLGNHPLWEIFRTVYQMTKRPFIIGGALLFLGFVCACLIGVERPISKELMRFIRTEQMQRLKRAVKID
jgi:glycosyltransferase involved in cell wall biosynthesis